MSNSADISPYNSVKQEFPWHHQIWQQFTKARTQNQLPHAILLSGEEGIAKLPLAKRMAKSLICLNYSSTATDACNECQSCKTYESGANPDFIHISLLEDKQQIGVDQIRALSEFLNYSRSYNTNRVVILNPAERMNINAANSLLKSLEEPSAHTVIILVTAKLNRLLPTIKSRCQLFTVKTPSKDESIHWLKQNRTGQNEDSDQSLDLEDLLEITGNKPLKAININQEDIDNRNQFSGFKHSNSTSKHDNGNSKKKWEKHDVETLLNWQILLIQQTIKSSFSTQSNSDNATNSMNKLSQHLSAEEHWNLYHNLIKQKQYIHTSVNSLMFMENMIMLWLKAA